MHRRSLLRGVAAVAPALMATGADAQNASFPSRPLRIVVGFAPGGGVDLVARPFAERFGAVLGQPVVVENRAGANGNLAATYVASNAAPDGYTLLQANGAMATNNPHLYRDGVPDYARDLVPITGITESPQAVMVPASLGVRTLQEFVELSRARPGELNFASGGNGTLAHLAFELFRRDQGLQIEHVPYRGTGPAVQDMVAGRMHLMIDNLSQAKGQIDAGLIRALAVTGPNRLAAVPDVPTTAEAGFPRLLAIGWQAVLAPARTPPAVLAVLRDAGRRVMAQPEFTAFLEARGSVARWRSATEMADRIQEESAFWGQIIRTSNIRLD